MTAHGVRAELGELLSPSQVKTYLTCPAKWYFHYLVGLTEPASGALVLGKAFHATLATNFRRKMASGRDLDPAEVSEVFAQEWILAAGEAELGDDEGVGELARTGEALVTTYIREAARSIQPRAVEQPVEGQIAGVKGAGHR